MLAIAQNFLHRRNVYIAVMGPTGVGKTTFINDASGSHLRVGTGLESQTYAVEFSKQFSLEKSQVTLIDTPGFDDTTKSDAEVLKAIAEFLARMRRQNQKLHGVIYLHRITDNRMGGTALRNFRMFRELCGIKALASCVIVLNMWNEVSEDVATARERELRETDIFFKPAMDAGASMLHHTNSPSSAQEILRDVVKKEPVVLQIQEEIVEQGKPIYETSAGVALLGDLAARQQRQLAQLQEMQRELEEAIEQQNESDRRELEEIEAGIKAKTAQLERDQESIRKDPIPEPRIDCRPQPKWMGALLVVAWVLTFWKRGRAQNG